MIYAQYRDCMLATARVHARPPRAPANPRPAKRKQPFIFVGMYLVPVYSGPPEPRLIDIQSQVARYFHTPLIEMTSARRAREVARPRQVAMYLAKRMTRRSLPQIGRAFGGRDHTTVIHAVRQVEKLRATDAAFASDVEIIRNRLEAA